MVRGKKKQSQEYVLSQNELRGLKDERKELESTLDSLEKDEYGKGTRAEAVDTSKVRQQIKNLDAVITRSTSKMSGVEKDKANSRIRELESKMAEGMPTRNEMRDPTNVHKHVQWVQRNQQRIDEFKHLNRRLSGDPSASNYERLRRER